MAATACDKGREYYPALAALRVGVMASPAAPAEAGGQQQAPLEEQVARLKEQLETEKRRSGSLAEELKQAKLQSIMVQKQIEQEEVRAPERAVPC